jgi:putative membrane protein
VAKPIAASIFAEASRRSNLAGFPQWHTNGYSPRRKEVCMKLFSNEFDANAKATLTLALCIVLALSAASLRADDNDKDKGAPGSALETTKAGKLSRADEKFVKDAAKGGMMEVHVGKLGVQKAQSDQVKQFAQRLIDDHTKANTELKSLATSKGVTLPEAHEGITSTRDDTDRTQVREKSDAQGTDRKERGAMKKLEGLSGTDFDREFVKMAVNDHEKDVKEFEKASKNCDDAELKSFASKTLPTLREHLSQAKSLQASVGAPSAATGTETGKSESETKLDSSK